MKAVQALIWLGMLVPMSVDAFWNIPVGRYDLRVNYFFVAAGGLLLLWQEGWAVARRLFLSADNRLFVAMLALGLCGILVSHHPSRSLLFVLWSAAALLLVPEVSLGLFVRLGPFLTRSLAAYVVLQTLVAGADSLTCIFKLPFPFLGVVFSPERLCRPHAWYQEPNYFAGFLLFCTLALRLVIETGFDRPARKYYWIAMSAACFGVILSTSRMGWIGLAGAVAIEILAQLKARRLGMVLKVGAACLGVGLLVTYLAPSGWRYSISSIQGIRTDLSLAERVQAADAAWEVFQQSPLIGVGPGAAGAYSVDEFPSHPFTQQRLSIRPREFVRSDPLSKDLFTELLAEWGGLGFLLFLGGLAQRLWRLPTASRLLAAWILPIVYSCSQTLQRFDLWTCLGVIFAVSAWSRGKLRLEKAH